MRGRCAIHFRPSLPSLLCPPRRVLKREAGRLEARRPASAGVNRLVNNQQQNIRLKESEQICRKVLET